LFDEIEEKPFSEKMKIKDFNEEKARLINEWLDKLRS